MDHSDEKSGKKVLLDRQQTVLVAVVCVLSAVVLVLLVIFVLAPAVERLDESSDEWYDPTAKLGTMPGKTPEEIQAELDKLVEEGMFNISIAGVIVFDDGSSYGAARIENIAANHYSMRVTITLDETNEVVYESKGLAPGQYIEYIKLDRDLPAGEYVATALFTTYTQEDKLKAGQAAAKITIVVGS